MDAKYFSTVIVNFRDLGGHYNLHGHQVRKDFIYRSSSLDRVAQINIKDMIATLRISDIFDLRSNVEVRSAMTKVRGATIHHVPAITEGGFANSTLKEFYEKNQNDMPQAFCLLYMYICNQSTTAYRTIFEHIRDHPQEPIVVHCEQGKDRTGVFCVLVLELCEVDELAILADYHLSEAELQKIRCKLLPKMLGNPFIASHPEAAEVSFRAPVEGMKRFLSEFRRRYGDIQRYMEHLGFNSLEVSLIKRNLLAKKGP